MEDYVVSEPELIVKFWPPSVSAKGAKAIEAVRRPLAFVLCARVVVGIFLGLTLLWGGHEYAPLAFRYLRAFL
jgi:hypothetical protein